MSVHSAHTRPLGALGRMGLVAAIHVGVLFVVAGSFGIIPPLTPERMVGTIIPSEPKPPDDPQPMPQPRMTDSPVPFVPQPDIDLEFEVIQTPITVQTLPPDEIPLGSGSAQVEGPAGTAVRLDSRHPLSQPPYPMSAIRGGHEGSLDLEVYVLANGRVGDARVVRSTGFDALDRSAMDEAKRKWRLAPATRNGEPVPQWHRLRVTFRLNQR